MNQTPLNEIHQKIVQFFKGDEAKARLWFDTPNPFFGNQPPGLLIQLGRIEKLGRIVDDLLEGNLP